MSSKYRRRTLVLLISGEIKGVDDFTFTDYDLTGAFLSSTVVSVVGYCTHNCDKSALGLVIRSDFTMSSLNARISML